MAQKQYPIINNFSKGELSSRMEGRVDIQGYYNGCKIMKNCIMVAQGGAEKRPGTIYLDETLDMDTEAKLVPFEVNDEEIYILEIGHKNTRIWDVQTKTLVQQDATTLILKTPYEDGEISSVQYATTEGQIFLAHSNSPIQSIIRESGRFSLKEHYFEVKDWIAQVYNRGDVVFSDPDYFRAIKTTSTSAPAVGEWEFKGNITETLSGDISEYTGGNFTLGAFKVYNGKIWKAIRTFTGPIEGQDDCFPGEEINAWEWKDESEEQNHNALVKSSDRPCIERWLGICVDRQSYRDYIKDRYTRPTTKVYDIVVAYWIGGAYVHFKTLDKEWVSTVSSNPYWQEVIGLPNGNETKDVYEWDIADPYVIGDVVYTSAMKLYLCISDGTGNTPGTAPEWESLDNNPFFAIEGDYPATVAFMNERLFLGGTLSQPHTFFASKIGQIGNFNIGVDDDDAYSYTIAAERSSRIKWMIAKDHLFIGTTDSEWLVPSGTTPTNVQILRQSAYGSIYKQPVMVADTFLFYQKGGKKLREYIYSNDNKAYLANDLTFFADHITNPGIDEASYQQNPDSILWNTKIDGGLVGLTYDRLNQIAGWHRHETQGEFESVASVTGPTDEDELWFVVRRYINGTFKRFIEYMAPRDFKDMIFSDSSATFTAGQTYTITSITNNTTYIEVAYEGSSGISNGDSIKIVGTESDLFDYQVFEVSSLNQGATTGTFQLKQDGEIVIEDPFTTITEGFFSISTKIITGLDHLLGETVSILGDNSVYADQEVVSDVDGIGGVGVTLSSACNKVISGLGYEMMLEPESIELQGTLGASRRISKALLKVYKTIGGYVGSNENNLEEIQYRDIIVPFGAPIPLYTGTKEVNIDASSEKEASVLIVHSQPLPMTVLAIVTDVSYSRS